MVFVHLGVKRPVFTTMFIMALVAVGLFSYGRPGRDLLPKIDRSTITTELAGASPEGMGTQSPRFVEEAITTIVGTDLSRLSR
jgi:multidrug efflux pump subunit AcrB